MLNPGYKQFGNYPNIGWMAVTAAEAYRAGHKFQINPDLDKFRLERIADLRKRLRPKEQASKLMLIGSSKTNIFIDGPDDLIDRMLERLPFYKDKSWAEIQNISLDKDTLTCQNAFSELCDTWISNNFEMKPLIPGKEIPELDIEKADLICAECKNYKFKGM